MAKDNIITEEFTLTLQYQMKINTDTGELLETKLIKRSVDKSNIKVVDTAKKTKIEESSEPELVLEENKFTLNSAAVKLMNVAANDKLEIKYEKRENGMLPIIGTDAVFGTGNKLNKSNSVAYRGNKNAELAKYGSVFKIVPHETREGVFILQGDAVIETVEDEDITLPTDADLDNLLDNTTEITSDFFKL